MSTQQKEGRRIYGFVITGILFFILSGWALAEEKFPNRPVNIVVAWPPGGPSHMDAQMLQPSLAKALRTSIVIINKPGAGGTVGWHYVVNSPPDGYTVAQIMPGLIFTRYTTKVGVSDDKFDHITISARIPFSLCVKADSPWETFNEFIAYAKTNPTKVQLGTAGIGLVVHMGSLGLEMVTGAKFILVPFVGTGQISSAVLGGHVDAGFLEVSTALPFVGAKKIKVLALADHQRSYCFPGVPTLKELGFDLYVDTWQGYSVPKGTPKDRIKILSDAFKAAIESEEYKAYCKKYGAIVEKTGPENARAFLDNQERALRKIVEFSGFKPPE